LNAFRTDGRLSVTVVTGPGVIVSVVIAYIRKMPNRASGIGALLAAKVKAEEELAGGEKFATKWGEAVAVYTGNSTVLDLGIKKGFALVVVKDPKRGNVRITGSNNKNVDLTDAYGKLTEVDSEGTWYLHPSKVLLRNGSSRNPQMVPTKLELGEIVEVLKNA